MGRTLGGREAYLYVDVYVLAPSTPPPPYLPALPSFLQPLIFLYQEDSTM